MVDTDLSDLSGLFVVGSFWSTPGFDAGVSSCFGFGGIGMWLGAVSSCWCCPVSCIGWFGCLCVCPSRVHRGFILHSVVLSVVKSSVSQSSSYEGERV